jgi:hypothetical protein
MSDVIQLKLHKGLGLVMGCHWTGKRASLCQPLLIFSLFDGIFRGLVEAEVV